MARNKNKNNHSNHSNHSNPSSSSNILPFVSVCTPTFNRRPFIEMMVSCFNSQDYPKDRMEWIIIDDGSDPIEDMVAQHPNVKYFKYDKKMTLGKKRNIMHDKSKGDIIVYMDDDDFYPPERVSHAVSRLTENPQALCAGASEMYIYFNDKKKMVQFGPYGKAHATAGTFAFRRALLKDSRYNDDACLAEEREFLKNYTVPFVQLEPLKTILVFSHSHNTTDKRTLLDEMDKNPGNNGNSGNEYIKYSEKKVSDFIKDAKIVKFFTEELEGMLRGYSAGDINMKPDVMKQIGEIEKKRKEIMANNADAVRTRVGRTGGGTIMFHEQGKPVRELNINEVAELLTKQEKQLSQFQNLKDLYGIIIRENTRLKEIIEDQQKILDEKNVLIAELDAKITANSDVVLVNIEE
jgi:glycosyltransferase involved in cell wall biosynthesis